MTKPFCDMEDKYTERLARYLIYLITIAIVATLCWYLRSIIIYILLSVLVTLLSGPFFKFVSGISVKGRHCPDWLCAILSIMMIFVIMAGVITTIVPLIRGIVQDISSANINNMAQAVSVPLSDFNRWISSRFPNAGSDFKIESVVLEQMQNIFDVSIFSSMVGSVTSFVANLGITLFAVVFISFFFVKTPGLVTSIITAIVPDKYEERVKTSIREVGVLVSRYFVGLVIEVFGVFLVNFIGLLLIARMGFKYSIGIAFITGILNIIPYIGPLMGGVIGVCLSLVIKYVCATSFGLAVGFLPFVLILAGIFTFAQMVDNYVYQPLIYSSSVKAHPLEIFIVFLIAGHVGGMVGMLVAIPSYTVLRVIARQFLGNVKAVRKLTL